MGEVWKARDRRLNRTVALKFTRQQFGERFMREARAVAALNHPSICILHDVGPDYLVMEYVDGTPLRGPVPLAVALAYAAQILDALADAHRHGIVHRDLKPLLIRSRPSATCPQKTPRSMRFRPTARWFTKRATGPT